MVIATAMLTDIVLGFFDNILIFFGNKFLGIPVWAMILIVVAIMLFFIKYLHSFAMKIAVLIKSILNQIGIGI